LTTKLWDAIDCCRPTIVVIVNVILFAAADDNEDDDVPVRSDAVPDTYSLLLCSAHRTHR